ncbi:hypothetical protein QKU48_gp1005 [Fadolivirus algeromassiliense]|jgi:hypothetical protein|uniref:Uncharacterized protein n=1 Tax=Fadolivirus FV1/VV64 TaxID=3070911 RepID=A0A7D3QUW0_9VIRU|nr:hypothetical protein QKU48_gp1005 [Fadolivirus algeromassiliense]QKF94463.1 hypothetical protein Fadolivirus_1_1005 [Fadolivirus FV1/VV64]
MEKNSSTDEKGEGGEKYCGADVITKFKGEEKTVVKRLVVSSYLLPFIAEGVKGLALSLGTEVHNTFLLCPIFRNTNQPEGYDVQVAATETKHIGESDMKAARRGLFEEFGLECSQLIETNSHSLFEMPASTCSSAPCEKKYTKGTDTKKKTKVGFLIYGSLTDALRLLDKSSLKDPNERITGYAAIRLSVVLSFVLRIEEVRVEWMKDHKDCREMPPRRFYKRE